MPSHQQALVVALVVALALMGMKWVRMDQDSMALLTEDFPASVANLVGCILLWEGLRWDRCWESLASCPVGRCTDLCIPGRWAPDKLAPDKLAWVKLVLGKMEFRR